MNCVFCQFFLSRRDFRLHYWYELDARLLEERSVSYLYRNLMEHD